MGSNNNRSGSFRIPPPSLSRQSSLPASIIERPTKPNLSAGSIREFENAMNTSSLLEDPEPEALTIDASNYDEETLEYIKPVVDLANEVLWHWKTFPIILPPPIETKIEPAAGITSTLRKKTIDRSDLFVEPNFDEVKSIAFNSRGERRLLTKEQLESVKLTGEFEVSISYNS